MKRGDVVLVDFPHGDGGTSKIRPALVVQADVYNKKLNAAILAFITGNLKHAAEPSNLLIDPATAAGASSGLHGRSVLRGTNLATVKHQKVLHTLGHLSAALMHQVNDCLKAALELP